MIKGLKILASEAVNIEVKTNEISFRSRDRKIRLQRGFDRAFLPTLTTCISGPTFDQQIITEDMREDIAGLWERLKHAEWQEKKRNAEDMQANARRLWQSVRATVEEGQSEQGTAAHMLHPESFKY